MISLALALMIAAQTTFVFPTHDRFTVTLGSETILDGSGSEIEHGSNLETTGTPAKDVYLGYPHGPKTSEFVPAGREKITDEALILKPFMGVIHASEDSFACDDRPDSPLGASFGNATSSLYNGVYDRKTDWLLTLSGNAKIVSEGRGTYRFSTEGPCKVTLKRHYYRDHLGYFLWSKDQPLWPAPVAGWSSWAAYGQGVDENKVKEAAGFFAQNLKDYGYSVIQIDDGYQRVLQNTDSPKPLEEPFAHFWTVPNTRFPSGLQSMASTISSLKLTPGIWVGDYLPLGLKHAEGYVTDPAGKPHKGPWVGYAVNGLDAAAREEAYIETIRELHAMGWRYFKIDTLRHVLYDNYRKAPGYWKARNQSMEEAYRKILAETKKTVGDSYLLACWGTLPELAGIPNGCRIGEDVGPDFDSMRRTAKYIAQFGYLNDVIWRNDPDYMCFRVPIEQAQAWATMNFLAGGQIMVSDPISDYDDARVDALRRVGPPILSKPLSVISHRPDPELMLLNAEKGGEHWMVAARFAWEPVASRTVSSASLGLEPDRQYLAFDFWKSRFLGTVSGSVSFDTLPQGACQVLCFRPLENHPQVLGDDRHLSQGAYELNDLHWNGTTLSGAFTGGPGRKWNLFLHVPAGWQVSAAATGLGTKIDGEVLTLTFPESKSPQNWKVKFERR